MSRNFDDSVATANSWRDKGIKMTNEEALQLYGLFKIGSGLDFDKDAKKPGMFELEAKYKYQSWEKYHKEGLTKEDAQKKYAETVDELEKKYVNK